ncbi:MAG: hypothetical protein RLZZ395_37, partial [Pseudomonadota bacterium]
MKRATARVAGDSVAVHIEILVGLVDADINSR